jgi:hypothetical protein
MRHKLTVRLFVVTVSLLSLGALAPAAHAQFSGGAKPETLPSPVRGSVQQAAQPTPEQIQKLYFLRYLQQRSGGGVKRGVPQFIPFGQPVMNPAAMLPQGQQAQPATTRPAKDKSAANKAAAERRAEAEAQREERRRLTRERAEKRKQEASQRNDQDNAK